MSAVVAVASVPAELRGRAWWLPAECLVSEGVPLRAAASEQPVLVVVWLVAARQQVAVPEAELAWAAWGAPEPVRLAGAVLVLAVVEPSRSLVAAWLARPRGSRARAPAAVLACTAAGVELSVVPWRAELAA